MQWKLQPSRIVSSRSLCATSKVMQVLLMQPLRVSAVDQSSISTAYVPGIRSLVALLLHVMMGVLLCVWEVLPALQPPEWSPRSALAIHLRLRQ